MECDGRGCPQACSPPPTTVPILASSPRVTPYYRCHCLQYNVRLLTNDGVETLTSTVSAPRASSLIRVNPFTSIPIKRSVSKYEVQSSPTEQLAAPTDQPRPPSFYIQPAPPMPRQGMHQAPRPHIPRHQHAGTVPCDDKRAVGAEL